MERPGQGEALATWAVWGAATLAGLMLSYGAVNMVQDLWLEQVVKRAWTDERIPSALLPGVTPVWGVVVALAVLGTLVLMREENRAAPAPAR